MFRLSRSHLQPIGIDIGHDGVRMLQLEVREESLHVRAAARQEFAAEARADAGLRREALPAMLRQMLRGNPFSGRSAVVALPREAVHLKNVRLPLMPPAELEAAVGFEAQQLLTFDPHETQVSYLAAGEVRQGSDVLQEVILVAARHADVNAFVEEMHSAGLELDALDVEPCALFRSVERFVRRREDEQEVHVLIDVGFNGSRIVIGRGREISFVKSLETGGRHFQEAVARSLNIPMQEARCLRRDFAEGAETAPLEQRDPVRQAVADAARSVMEQLAREISLCLRYHLVTFRGQRPDRVRLLGGEAGDPQLRAVLQTALGVPVETGRPFCSVDTSRMKVADRRGAMAEWALALGLALRRAPGHFGARDGRPRSAQPRPVTADSEPAPAGEASHA